jgi:hypothetical protein
VPGDLILHKDRHIKKSVNNVETEVKRKNTFRLFLVPDVLYRTLASANFFNELLFKKTRYKINGNDFHQADCVIKAEATIIARLIV